MSQHSLSFLSSFVFLFSTLADVRGVLECDKPTLSTIQPYSEFTFCHAYHFISGMFNGEKGSSQPYVDNYFPMFDKSPADGYLSKREVQLMNQRIRKYTKPMKIRRIVGIRRQKKVDRIIKALDANRDGRISSTEVTSHLERKRPVGSSGASKKKRILPWILLAGFEMFDKNRDGYMNWEEVEPVVCTIRDNIIAENYCAVVRRQFELRKEMNGPPNNRIVLDSVANPSKTSKTPSKSSSSSYRSVKSSSRRRQPTTKKRIGGKPTKAVIKRRPSGKKVIVGR